MPNDRCSGLVAAVGIKLKLVDQFVPFGGGGFGMPGKVENIRVQRGFGKGLQYCQGVMNWDSGIRFDDIKKLSIIIGYACCKSRSRDFDQARASCSLL
jgi:hypothetical protein